MAESTKYDEKGTKRRELDNELAVKSWYVPGDWERRESVSEGPIWWQGDEDASQSFLASQGVRL